MCPKSDYICSPISDIINIKYYGTRFKEKHKANTFNAWKAGQPV